MPALVCLRVCFVFVWCGMWVCVCKRERVCVYEWVSVSVCVGKQKEKERRRKKGGRARELKLRANWPFGYLDESNQKNDDCGSDRTIRLSKISGSGNKSTCFQNRLSLRVHASLVGPSTLLPSKNVITYNRGKLPTQTPIHPHQHTQTHTHTHTSRREI